MKILKLLSRKYLPVLLIIFFCIELSADEKPVDIWNLNELEKNNSENETSINENKNNVPTESKIYKMQTQNQDEIIQLDQELDSKEIKITGLYDAEDYGLDMYMWTNSDGDQLKNLFSRLSKIDLSEDATEILKISILTNAYYPQKNISEKEFLKFKSDWLIKNSDLNLIEQYIIKNEIFDENSNLTRFLVDEYLSDFNVNKACEIFSKNKSPISDEYLSKFNIYCLIVSEKKK